MDKLDAMRAFVQVAKTGSFSAAGEKLDKSPQLMSKYVSQLEELLATRLFNRTTRRVHLTEAGEQYFPQAMQVLEDIESIENRLGNFQDKAHGLLRISAPVAFATMHLAPLLNEFQKHHPDVDIDLHLNDRKVDIIEEGFDVALRIGQLKSSSLIAKRLTSIKLVMCASPEYLTHYGEPQQLEDLTRHNYLRYSYLDNENSPEPHAYLLQGELDEIGKISCNHGELLCQSAVMGQGIVIQPTFICSQAIKQGRLKVIMREYTPSSLNLYAVYANRQFLPNKVSAFIHFAANFYGDTPYWDDGI
ncbi:LysR family transcriptional regulator [Glaciecola sp. 1036]|uniref:LysR family transcriptional regulator n=1 Tax=Alteromonadaceae TaxID=72275 RepID=UPI003D091197